MGFRKQFELIKVKLRRSGLIEIRVLLTLLFIIAGIWFFVEIAEEVTEGSTIEFDKSIMSLLREGEHFEKPRGPQWLTSVVRDVTSLGGGTIAALITFAVIGFLLLHKEYHAMWMVLAGSVGGMFIIFILKSIFERERPTIIESFIQLDSYSFPSGHSTISAVIYLTLAALLARLQKERIVKIYIISIAVLLTFIIGVSRIYLARHYPTDVLAGWSIGLAWASICWFVANYIKREKHIEDI